MKIKANLQYKPSNFQMDDCVVERVVLLSADEFSALRITPLRDQPFIEKNKDCMFSRDGVLHCLLALGEGSRDGVLIESEGYNFPRYAAYVPGMRDIVNAELARAADLIVQQGTEHTSDGEWRIWGEELEEQTGLTIREGNGLDTMLKTVLGRRPEVAGVTISLEHIDMTYHPEFCKTLGQGVDANRPDIRVRDILPLLADSGGTFFPEDSRQFFFTHQESDTYVWPEHLRKLTPTGQEDHATLLNARVSEIRPGPDGMGVVLTDVEPEELARFNEAYENFQEAEQVMGDMTP